MRSIFDERGRDVWLAGCLITAALVLFLVAPAIAQSPDKTIQEATLQLWPEYDDPGLLVIFAGDFGDAVASPVEVAFPVPDNARNIQATSREPDGRLITQAWKIVDGKLTYTLPGRGFHIEYYLDRPPSGEQRDLGYTFELPYAISALEIRAQQPARASGFSLEPQPDSSTVSDDGLTYSVARKSNLKAGERLDVGIRYSKPDQGLTRPSLPAETAPTQVTSAQAAAPQGDAGSWLPWLLIGVGLLALGAIGGYWIWRGGKTSAPARGPKASEPTEARSGAGAANDTRDGAAYCTQCGSRFRPGDRFCANCGASR